MTHGAVNASVEIGPLDPLGGHHFFGCRRPELMVVPGEENGAYLMLDDAVVVRSRVGEVSDQEFQVTHLDAELG